MAETDAAEVVHARITGALVEAARELGGWERAGPYLRRRLARHAYLGNSLLELDSHRAVVPAI